jgi:hypothetical protein
VGVRNGPASFCHAAFEFDEAASESEIAVGFDDDGGARNKQGIGLLVSIGRLFDEEEGIFSAVVDLAADSNSEAGCVLNVMTVSSEISDGFVQRGARFRHNDFPGFSKVDFVGARFRAWVLNPLHDGLAQVGNEPQAGLVVELRQRPWYGFAHFGETN